MGEDRGPRASADRPSRSIAQFRRAIRTTPPARPDGRRWGPRRPNRRPRGRSPTPRRSRGAVQAPTRETNSKSWFFSPSGCRAVVTRVSTPADRATSEKREVAHAELRPSMEQVQTAAFDTLEHADATKPGQAQLQTQPA